MENYHAKRKVYDAVAILSDFTGKSPNQIVSLISLLGTDKEMFQKFKTMADEVNEFHSLSLKERCEIMGYRYKEKKNGVLEISTELKPLINQP